MVCVVASGAPAQKPTLVLVAGRQVEVIRAGTGSPTIVLESGAGDSVLAWKGVIRQLAKHSRVIAYSRSGFGKSAPGTSPPSPQSSVRDLNELLQTLGERKPVVIAGHSWGGLLARLYASTYPAEVSGLVLIDATHESQFHRWEALRPGFHIADTLRAMTSKLPQTLRLEYEQFIEVESSERVDGMKPLADIPLAVITAVKPCPPDREWVCQDPKAIAVWRALHDEWFARSTRGMRLVSGRTTHDVITDQPSLIITAVKFVLDEVRALPRGVQ